MLIKRTKVNIFRIGNIRIYPGVTEITDEEQIQILTNHPSWQPMIDNGTHIIIEKESSGKSEEPTADIAEMKANDAIAVIRETLAIPILENMYNREMDDKGRKSVLSAITDQIEEIRKPPEAPKDEE